MGTGRGSCATRQNTSADAQSEEAHETHQVDLERSQTSRAEKRPYQAVSTTSRNALGTSETRAPMKRTHHDEIPAQEVTLTYQRSRGPSRSIRTARRLSRTPYMMGNIPGPRRTSATPKRAHHAELEGREVTWATERSRKSSRAIRTAQRLSMAPDTMGNDPRASGTRATSKRTRYVEIEGQEAIWTRQLSREISAVNRSAEAMETASRRTGQGAAWMAQRAAHGATRNESKRDR